MQLSEKIKYCRKKAGLSQEALAENLAVSRQSISKWETGDAVPELGKLLLIAKTFGVTTDWLLSDEEPPQDQVPETDAENTEPAPQSTWVDSVPGVIGRMLRRYGWLFGVYLAVMGVIFTGMGALARTLVNSINNTAVWNRFPGDAVYFDSFGAEISTGFPASSFGSNPVSIMGSAIMGFGIVMIIAGVILAFVLKNRSTQ